MFNELYQHKVAYIILTVILILHIILFLSVWPTTWALRVVALSLTVSYFCWGVFAHVKAQHITRQIVREYLFASLLGGGMLLFLTL
jgi:hypothetical protein